MQNIITFMDKNKKVIYIAKNSTDTTVTEQQGNLRYLSIIFYKKLQELMEGDKIEDYCYLKLYNKREKREEEYKILRIEAGQVAEHLKIQMECISANYAIYKNKYVNVKLAAGTTLLQALNVTLKRTEFFDFINNIGIIEEDAGVGLTEEKEIDEEELLNVLVELQNIYNRYLYISEDGKINFYKDMGKNADVLYVYGKNYKKLKKTIDKEQTINKVIGRAERLYTTAHNGFAINGDFSIFYDTDEKSLAELKRKTIAELNKRRFDTINWELETNFIEIDEKYIREIFNVGDFIKIYNPFLSSEPITQKVVELQYNAFYPYLKPVVQIADKKETLAEFLQNQVKTINKVKRRLTKQ